jgi:transcriptional regulator with XRE-family HTH domain
MELHIGRLLHKRGMKQIELADTLDVTPGYISQLISGKRNPSPEMLVKMAQALDVDVSAILQQARPIAVAGRVGAGASVQLVDSYAKGDGLYHIACPDDLPATGIVAVEVEGASMEPLIHEGDVILFSRHFIGIDERVIGNVAICETADGRALVKQIKRGRDPGTFDLFSLNTTSNGPEYGVRLKWAAPYRRHLRAEDVEKV